MASRDPILFNDGPDPAAGNSDTTWNSHQQSPAGPSNSSRADSASLHSVRKRASFFGRSNSDASSMRRAPATSHSTNPSFSGRVDDTAYRPSTASSSESGRRRAETLQSLRDSIFGGKKKVAPARDRAGSLASRPSSRGTHAGTNNANMRPYQYRTEDDCR